MHLPPILDVRDDLRRALADASDDVGDEYRAVVERLDEFVDRDDADRQGLLDEIDNQLLRVEEKVRDDDASRQIHAIRERIHVYRDDLSNPGANLVVEDADLRTSDGDPADVGDLRGRSGVVRARVLDNGSGRTVGVAVTFVGEWGDVLEEATSPATDLEPGETGTFEFDVAVPEDAVDWAVVPVEVT